MKHSLRRFTLVEMLTVIAIISILAGMVISGVVIAQESGRETQAKSDITALLSALKQMDSDYGKVLKKNGSNYQTGDTNVTLENCKVMKADGSTDSGTNTLAKIDGDAYNAMIAELSAPKNKKFTSSNPVSVNRRKKIYLEPKEGFNPTEDYDDSVNEPFLWRDPWGNPYMVYVKVTRDGMIEVPGTSKVIAADVAIYSFGPNGTDDKGCNKDLDTCIHSSDSSNHKLHDDISSWEMK